MDDKSTILGWLFSFHTNKQQIPSDALERTISDNKEQKKHGNMIQLQMCVCARGCQLMMTNGLQSALSQPTNPLVFRIGLRLLSCRNINTIFIILLSDFCYLL